MGGWVTWSSGSPKMNPRPPPPVGKPRSGSGGGGGMIRHGIPPRAGLRVLLLLQATHQKLSTLQT